MSIALYKCTRCLKELPREAFYTRYDRRYESDRFNWCMVCHNRHTAAYYQKTKERAAIRGKRLNLALKTEAMNFYGQTCACCGECDPRFLEVDHIGNDGAEHREQMGNRAWGGVSILRWLRANNWPEGFQFLCSNCNQAKYRHDICPHHKRCITPELLSDSLGYQRPERFN